LTPTIQLAQAYEQLGMIDEALEALQKAGSSAAETASRLRCAAICLPSWGGPQSN